MSSMDRQNKLLISEDWKKIYQSFKNAEFKSYDFDSLRRIMISYLRENYPEDFNDYIESSEYIALIDLIAFLGQNLAFRIDLNARENFLDLAERKESILRLARLLSYNPKRNQCASGLLKIVGISTTEQIIASNNNNLQNQTIIWSDSVNKDWYEHFTRIISSALSPNSTIGHPIKKANINGIPTKLYRFNGKNDSKTVFPYKKSIKGTSLSFEIVSSDITENNALQEDAPLPGQNLSFLYRDDGQGPSGNNTGFFCMFKQGTLNNGTFEIKNPSTNQKVVIDTPNINNSDVWLYSLDTDNKEDTLWEQVSSVNNNIIYNNVPTEERNIYTVLTQENDKINLIFSDGQFGDLPHGHFKVYYRVSKNQNTIIHPNNMRGVTITVPYMSQNGIKETLTLTLSLKYTVDNASITENNASIKRNAPATYYTQNRLVTAEDYQLGADSVSQDIIKTKTINRISSGISRYYDLSDPTGKYSNTILFGDDGILYKKYNDIIDSFHFENTSDIEGIIYNMIEPILGSSGINNFYMDMYPRISVEHFNIKWKPFTEYTGNFIDNIDIPLSLKEHQLRYVKTNTLLKFVPPAGHVFVGNSIVPYEPNMENWHQYKWIKVLYINNNGVTNEFENGHIVFNDIVPDGSLLTEIITTLPTTLSAGSLYQIANQISSYRTFGLRYSREENEWRVIQQNNLNISEYFSTANAGDTSTQQKDNSWFILFNSINGKYTIKYKTLEYVFESENQIKFYYDSENKKRDKIKKQDLITLLSVNRKPGTNESLGIDHHWQIEKEYRDLSSYVNGKKVIVALHDKDLDGVIDDPDLFKTIVNEDDDSINKLVFLKSNEVYDKINDYEYIPLSELDVKIYESKNHLRDIINHKDNQLYYFIKENIFERLNKKTLSLRTDPGYKAYYGRDNIKFKYVHYANETSRIDPAASNIMDTFILTNAYDIEFRKWLAGNIEDKPLPPSSDALHTNYSSEISKIKSISDDIVYHSVKFKVLFGKHANIQERARLKVVKNDEVYINDNELKTDIIHCINRYFSIDNWNFGETFHFSELAAYVIKELSPKIVSFIIVPVQENLNFGALFEIHCEPDEIFISDATIMDIDIIDAITASNIKSSGNILTTTNANNNAVISSYE